MARRARSRRLDFALRQGNPGDSYEHNESVYRMDLLMSLRVAQAAARLAMT